MIHSIPNPLKLKLFGKLYVSLVLSSIVLIWSVILIADYAESRVSHISDENKKVLLDYAAQAEALYLTGDTVAMEKWVAEVMAKENTWVAIIKVVPIWYAGGYDAEIFYGYKNLSIARRIEYPIHLYYDYNPIMQLPMGDTGYNLLIQLPARLRPGAYWKEVDLMIKLGLPVLLIALLTYLIYRHLIIPIRTLQTATRKFTQGDYQIRTQELLSHRNDELSDLAKSFDNMVERIGCLVQRQRQLIQDISHELRTPITRIKLAMNNQDSASFNQRVESEIDGMQALLEDTLTLSWLNNEATEMAKEDVDLVLLIDAIADDAGFEFPDHQLVLDLPDSCLLRNSNHRALGQAIENVIRNAMKYSPANSAVCVNVRVKKYEDGEKVVVEISDEGQGVKTEYLEEIFEPFFRVSQARDKASGGYGLGLALSRRQVEAIGGTISAKHNNPKGLIFEIVLPLSVPLDAQ